MSADGDRGPVSRPPYNPIFETLVPTGSDLDIRGFVAYGLYKVAKREWAAQIRDTYRRAPTDEGLIADI